MAIIRWTERNDPFRAFDELERLQQEMNRLFSSFGGSRTPRFHNFGVFPPLNISEDTENLYVRGELPGISSNDIDISVEGETLTLRGERKLPQTASSVSYHRREREAGKFRRTVSLSTRINPDGVEAHFQNGVLEIVLPKAAEAKPRQIPVKVGG
jgi:HSP20 family protein